MDSALFVHRLHFAFTITLHYLFPQLTMGLAPLIVVLKTLALRNNDETYHQAARFWGRIFGINFVFGVVTEYCVSSAVKGLLERGRRVAVVRDAIETLNPEQGSKAAEEWQRLGAKWTTTNQALAAVTAAAIEHGKHVLVEKPAARNAVELAPVVEAGRARG